MKLLRFIVAAVALALPAFAQNKMTTVGTVTEMLAQPPETFAASPSFGTNTAYLSYVETTGDTARGTGKKTWYWSPSSTLATNTAANNGPFAYPYGASTGRWLYVPDGAFSSYGVSLASIGVVGEIPYFFGTNSIKSSGYSTNALKFVSRVVLTATELLAVNPQMYVASVAENLAYVTTTGDSVAGSGQRHWMWDALSTASTNFVGSGGPLAWPYGASTGRWVEVKPYTATSARIMFMTSLYPDASDGTVNTNDPAPYFNTNILAASLAYDPVLGKVTLDWPDGLYTCNELLIRGHVRNRSLGQFHCRKRSEPVGTVNRSVATTVRLGYANQDPVDGSFLSWGDSGTNIQYYAAADNWYGASDDIEFEGPGKFIFDQANKSLTQPALRLLEVRNFWSAPGCLEVWLAASTNSGNNSYGIQPCGRNVVLNYPIVRGGSLTTQDGIHMGWGENIFINGAYVESGDDSIACQAEAAGGFTSPPDEPLRHVRVVNVNVHSERARAAIVHHGNNQINIPYTNRTPSLQDIIIDGINGTAGLVRQSGLQIGNWMDGTSIQAYTLTSGGSGYTDGYWGLPITATAGGSGAYCIAKVAGGVITRCYPAKAGTGTGWLVNKSGGYTIGATNIAIDSGTGYIFAGDKIKFSGDSTIYTVYFSSNNAALYLTSGITANLADNATITIQSSTSAWKTGTGYRQDEAPVLSLIPGGSGAVIVAPVFGIPNNNIVDCGIQNFNLEIGSTTHDGTEPYAFRIHGVTRGWYRNGRISVTENSTNAAHRPYFISSCLGFDVQNVYVSPTTSGGYIRADDAPKAFVDDLVFDNFELGPHNKSGHGLVKINGTNGVIRFNRCKFHIGSGQTAIYLPDLENSRVDYTDTLEFINCRFDAPVSGVNKLLDIVPSGGSGVVCGMFRFVGNNIINVNSYDTAAVIQTGFTSYEIRDNTGGMRTKLQIQVTQNSGSTTVSIPINTQTGLLDATTASLPQITGIVPVDYLGNWRLRANSTTAATLETATAPSSNVLWNVTIDTSRKPLINY